MANQNKPNLSSVWFQGCKTDEDKDKIKALLLNDHFVLDKLSKIVYNMVIKNTKATKQDYTDASWAFKQAHVNGELDALRKILSIIDVLNEHEEHK
jgi:hypothetical protein